MTQQLTLYFDSGEPVNDIPFSLSEGGQFIDSGSIELAKLHANSSNIGNLDKNNTALENLNLEECEVTVVIPGDQVTTLMTPVPKGSRRLLAQALPYLLEDELAAPVESLHIVATTKPDADGKLLCAIIDRSLLERHLERLSKHDIAASIMIPNYWTLPKSNRPQISQKNHHLLVRLGSDEGITLPATSEKSLLLTLLPEFSDQQLNDIPQWHAKGKNSAPLNLLQGEFAPAGEKSHLGWIKPMAITVAFFLAIFIAYSLISGWYFNQQASEIAKQSEAQYKKLFPNDKRIVDIRRQMQAHLNNNTDQQSSSLFFELLNAFSSAKDPDSEPGTIRNIRFDQDRGSMQIEIQSGSINYANALQNKLQSNGIEAEVLSANSNAEGVITRLRIGRNNNE